MDDRNELSEYVLSQREAGLMTQASVVADRCSDQNAVRHLRQGFYRRVLYLRDNRFHIRQVVEENDGNPLGVYVATDLNIHLNSFYIHLRGALDNLAWALNLEILLLPGVDEDNPRSRGNCYLFGNKFITALEKHHPAAAAAISAHRDWEQDFKSRRDPIAHRIPLYAVHAVANEREAEGVRELQRKAGEAIAAKEFHRGVELIHEASQLGRYEPWLVESTTDGLRIRHLPRQMAWDSQNFVEVCEPVLVALTGGD